MKRTPSRSWTKYGLPVALLGALAAHASFGGTEEAKPMARVAATSADAIAPLPPVAASVAVDDPKEQAPLVEMAILLDTSGSMDGLINQVKTKLWAIVNDLALAERGGRKPRLRVALYEYGKSDVPASEGHIRQIVGLSEDLDEISEELFALRTNGGDEFCGLAIQTAARKLEWSEGDHYKAIYIAGNEPFTQGPTEPSDACKAAIAKGIVVNTIHCGSESEGRQGGWDQGAQLADGRFLNIDQDAVEVALVAPQDQRLSELSQKLNATYVAFGDAGRARQESQRRQDMNAAAMAPQASAERATAKASHLYKNASWDLVDALEEKAVELEALDEADLPAELRGKDAKEIGEAVAVKKAEREAIQAEIQSLSAKRKDWIDAERARLATEGQAQSTFDSAARKALRQQMQSRGYVFH